MKKIALAAAALAAAGTAASAANAQDFQGPYVGAQAGWSHEKVGQAPWDDYALSVDKSDDVASGGLYLGYDHLISRNVVLGLEAGISAGTKDKLVRPESGATVGVDPKHSAELSVRAGYLLTPETLAYVRGGYSNLRAETTQAGKDGVLHHTANLDGWVAGAGIERLLTTNVSTRLEYRYSDFGGDGSDLKRHQVLLGVAYRF
jgi:outer membrane immunogenic protein